MTLDPDRPSRQRQRPSLLEQILAQDTDLLVQGGFCRNWPGDPSVTAFPVASLLAPEVTEVTGPTVPDCLTSPCSSLPRSSSRTQQGIGCSTWPRQGQLGAWSGGPSRTWGIRCFLLTELGQDALTTG